MNNTQHGNILIGLIIGLVIGLGFALGVAVYVTKVPVPFVTKTQRGGPEQDEAEARRNRDWDPNAPLAGKRSAAVNGTVTPAVPADNASSSGPAPSGAASNGANASNEPDDSHAASASNPSSDSETKPAQPVVVPVEPKPNGTVDPLGDLARQRAAATPDPFIYFVQAGAFRTTDEADTQRAKLSLMGVEARVTERDQAGRTVFRVRAGPFDKRAEADRLKERLDGNGLETALVRVQR